MPRSQMDPRTIAAPSWRLTPTTYRVLSVPRGADGNPGGLEVDLSLATLGEGSPRQKSPLLT
jgi:hypothetical protein